MTEIVSQNPSAEAVQAYQEGDFVNAARLFGDAASLLSADGKKTDAAEMKNNQSVAFAQCGNAQAALDAVHGTDQIFAEAGDFRRQGLALSNEATALEALKRFAEALGFYRSAADALEKANEDQARAAVMQAVAGIQLRQGKVLEALLSMRIGLAGVKTPTLKQKILRGMLRLVK